MYPITIKDSLTLESIREKALALNVTGDFIENSK